MGSRVTEYSSLEQVHRRAAWFAYCKYERTASVTSMLNDLKWESLETRRNSQRLTMFYRMQLNMVSTTPADYLVPVQSSRSRRSGVSSPLRADRCLQTLLFPCNCAHVKFTTSNCYPVSLNSVDQSRHQCSSPALTHATTDVHLSA